MITTTTRMKIAPLPLPLPLPLPPLLLLWQQWRQHGVAACGRAR